VNDLELKAAIKKEIIRNLALLKFNNDALNISVIKADIKEALKWLKIGDSDKLTESLAALQKNK